MTKHATTPNTLHYNPFKAGQPQATDKVPLQNPASTPTSVPSNRPPPLTEKAPGQAEALFAGLDLPSATKDDLGRYSEEYRRAIGKLVLEGAFNMTELSRWTGVPVPTIRQWRERLLPREQRAVAKSRHPQITPLTVTSPTPPARHNGSPGSQIQPSTRPSSSALSVHTSALVTPPASTTASPSGVTVTPPSKLPAPLPRPVEARAPSAGQLIVGQPASVPEPVQYALVMLVPVTKLGDLNIQSLQKQLNALPSE